MGKGDFIIENALRYKDINFIGIEKYDSVIVRAIQKSNELELNNLKIVRIDANKLEEVFDKEIDTIYLNFSDPWPKSRHEDRRLTSPEFLKMYNNILNDDGCVIFKTDNREFFDYSVETFKENVVESCPAPSNILPKVSTLEVFQFDKSPTVQVVAFAPEY